MRNYARAEELLRRATAIPQPFGGAFTNLVALQVATGKVSAAESTQAAFRSRLPSNTTHWYSDALIAVGRSDLGGSDSIARAAFADPKAASAREFAAVQLKQGAQVRGRIRDAFNWLGKTAELQTGDAQTRLPALRAALENPHHHVRGRHRPHTARDDGRPLDR